jgi:catechol 2,3-dioxygenase-like lactoylglutathione lyase family enzyme
VIDHVSVGVRSLEASRLFYDAILGALGHERLVEEPRRVGYGKRYPEFWINARPGMHSVDEASGSHVCLRARSPGEVDAFHAAALLHGGRDDGRPGARRYTRSEVYAAFIRDPDGNRIEAVTILGAAEPG